MEKIVLLMIWSLLRGSWQQPYKNLRKNLEKRNKKPVLSNCIRFYTLHHTTRSSSNSAAAKPPLPCQNFWRWNPILTPKSQDSQFRRAAWLIFKRTWFIYFQTMHANASTAHLHLLIVRWKTSSKIYILILMLYKM